MRRLGFSALALLALGAGCATLPFPAPGPVRYVDAHSHLVASLPPTELVAKLKAAGVSGVVLMDPQADVLRAAAAANPGVVVPFISLARLPTMPGLRLGPDAAAAMAALEAEGAVCGFGEIPTRIEPRLEADDAAALTAPDRMAIYAVAAARGVPVNFHVSLSNPATIAAIEAISARYPRMPLILAHAGWEADAPLIGRLIAAHRNVHADLSIRLDRPVPGSNDARLSIVGPDGQLLPDWRALIERFPDRFLFALDISGDRRPLQIAALVAGAKATLGHLPRATENAVAHGNIERLTQSCKRKMGL
jgi:predicted TIM-barrel fold metal-dependent hydrolase